VSFSALLDNPCPRFRKKEFFTIKNVIKMLILAYRLIEKDYMEKEDGNSYSYVA
jgi:hypothetical protein